MECKDIALKLNTCLVWTQYPSPPKKEQWQRNRVKRSATEECPGGHRWWGPNKTYQRYLWDSTEKKELFCFQDKVEKR